MAIAKEQLRQIIKENGIHEFEVPRDRNAEFEPKIILKYQRDISGIELSAEMVSKITDRIIPY